MISNVVDELLEAMLRNKVIFDSARCGFPFEVEQTVVLIISRLPTWKEQIFILIVESIGPTALFQDPGDDG